MGGRGMVAPGGGRENYKAARSRRSFARTLGGAAQQAENVPSMDVTSQRMGGTSPATVLHVDPRVASAAGVRGTSIGRVIAQPDGRHRAESAIAGQKPR